MVFWFENLKNCYRRQAGHRIGEHLEKVIPLVVKYSRVEDDELREYCLQAFESFVRRCPKDISPHIPMVNFCCHYWHQNAQWNVTVFKLLMDDFEFFCSTVATHCISGDESWHL